jgi:purine-nucleoside phosphorylase
MTHTRADYEKAATLIRESASIQPEVGLVLGSGLGGLAEQIEDRVVIPYADIPGWPQSTVQGHSGQLVIGRMEGKPVIVQQGRAHFYEGYTPQQITFPIRVMRCLDVKTVILTNAAGGLNTRFQAGDLMVLNDHINFVGMGGINPLIGPNDETFGERFTGMVHTYDRELRQLAQRVAVENGITLHEGVYINLAGPNFETPAEIRMLRTLGADAVGMSTVPEVIIARHAGMRVLAFSSITNMCFDTTDVDAETNHEEVLEVGRIIVPRLMTILKGVLKAITL